LIVLLTLAAVAGCGESNQVTFSRGVIHVGVGVNDISLTKSVLGIGVGTKESDVRARLGEPYERFAHGRLTCWGYHADQGGSSTSMMSGASSLDGLLICMSPSHRVARIVLGHHG
jgi:hypothetical protein